MQNRPGVRQIAAERATRLPWLAPPAGYIVLIQDVAYGNRYKIARHQQLDQHQIQRGADFPFETRVVLILEAENAEETERDLQDELAAGTALGDWFDLAQFPPRPPAPTAAPAPTQAQESVSLLDLVENDEGADSLLQEAEIVATKGHVSTPRRRSRPQPSRARRRRPRAARWAFALGLLVFVGVFAAEHGGAVGRAIESILGAGMQQSTSPTSDIEGENEVFYTKIRSQVRSCAKQSCRLVAFLSPGNKITARRYVSGQEIEGSARWIAFLHKGELRYIHESALARAWPPEDSTRANRSSASPTPKIPGRDEVFFAKTRSRVRYCANMSCRTNTSLGTGTKITARRYVSGQEIDGSDRWIAFLHQGELRYIHESALARTWPPEDSTTTNRSSSSPTPKIPGRDEVYYTKKLSRVRSCANMNCRTAGYLIAGTKITARRYVSGQQVDGSARWIAIAYKGELGYIHDSDLSRTWPLVEPTPEPSPTAQPTRIKATTVGRGEVYYVRSKANARACAQQMCEILNVLPPGTKITALRFIQGDSIDGNDLWIRFLYYGRQLSIHSGELSRTPPAASSTRIQASAEGQGEVFYVISIANARRCARRSCEVLEVLLPGTKITALRFSQGQEIDGNDLWIRFSHNRRHLSIHSGKLSRTPPTAQPTAEGEGEVFFVKARAIARACAQTSCEISDVLPPGKKITALYFEKGQPLLGSDHWIRFNHKGRHLSIHSSKLSRTDPMAATLAAPPPPNATSEAAGLGAEFHVKIRARARTCPRPECDVAATLPKGTQIVANGYVSGQSAEGDDGWVSFDYNGRNAYIRRSLLSRRQLGDEPDGQPSTTTGVARRSQSSAADLSPLFVSERATVYKCVNTRCQAIDVLERGAKIYPSGEWYGQRINDSTVWIRFRHEDHTVYIHSSYVTEREPVFESTATDTPPTATATATDTPPTATLTATESLPTATATVVAAAKYVVETAGNANANIRSCPRTNCEIVAKYAPGEQVEVIGEVAGEAVYGTDIWYEIKIGEDSAFIHSELAAEAG